MEVPSTELFHVHLETDGIVHLSFLFTILLVIHKHRSYFRKVKGSVNMNDMFGYPPLAIIKCSDPSPVCSLYYPLCNSLSLPIQAGGEQWGSEDTEDTLGCEDWEHRALGGEGSVTSRGVKSALLLRGCDGGNRVTVKFCYKCIQQLIPAIHSAAESSGSICYTGMINEVTMSRWECSWCRV